MGWGFLWSPWNPLGHRKTQRLRGPDKFLWKRATMEPCMIANRCAQPATWAGTRIPVISLDAQKGFATKRSIRIPGRVVPLSSDRALPRELLPEPFAFRWLLRGFASELQNAQRELKMRPHVDSMPSLETKVSGANPGNSFQNRSLSVGF